MPVLNICKFDKDPIKNDLEKVATPFSLGASGCHDIHSFDPVCPKT